MTLGFATDEGRARPISSWDEFSPLREVIVGDPAGARVPRLDDPSAWLIMYPTLTRQELERVHQGQFPRQVIEETAEDLAALVQTLELAGVVVHQPPAVDHSKTISIGSWTSTGYYSYCPRDVVLVLGSMIIEAPSPQRARYVELFGMRDLFMEFQRRGAHWIAAPKPELDDSLYEQDEIGRPLLGEREPVFDAANVIRIGRDVFYQVSRSGNERGMEWLQATLTLLGDVRVHPLRDIYGYTHIDSTIAVLRPGLVMLNPSRIGPNSVPDQFKKWDVIWCPEIRDTPVALPHQLSEKWISMNVLMLSPHLAIADETQTELLKLLEENRIEVIPGRLRHARVLGGGFHCVTLDVVRDGGPESYLD
jgi:glycine amidinotransferase